MDAAIGKSNGTRNTLNFQPVIPLTLSAELSLITRVVLPFVSQKYIYAEGSHKSGLVDALISIFLSPSYSKNGLTWGAGPAILVPTATNDLLGTKKLGVGPTAILLKQTHGWTVGALANQIWSVAGDKDREDVSQFYLQPFLTHNWKSGSGLGIGSEITRNWQAGTTSVFIIPTSRASRIGRQTAQLNIGPRIQTSAAEGRNADFGVRSSVVFIFPK